MPAIEAHAPYASPARTSDVEQARLVLDAQDGTPFALGPSCRFKGKLTQEGPMLWTLIVLLVILWALGFVAFNVGGLIHILLVVALIALVYQLVTGRRVT